MQERQGDSLMTDVFSNLVKGRGDKGEKYYKNNCLASVRAPPSPPPKKRKDEEANTQKNKMIKKNTRKVVFGKKRNPVISACAIPESWALESFFQFLKGIRNQSR